jgi:hypothetical protein
LGTQRGWFVPPLQCTTQRCYPEIALSKFQKLRAGANAQAVASR